tara:strand:+ start:382 stop:564 length:183 start_codon:yes stop_codon:yes gene_type:complete
MTKKDFIAIASIFNKHLDTDNYLQGEAEDMFWMLVFEFEGLFANSNENFDSSKFMEAIKK